MSITKLRWQQRRDPSRFLQLELESIEFNPHAYLREEQDYLELGLKVTGGLLTALHLDRMVGELSIDGTGPKDPFEIANHCVIERTGQSTKWGGIVARLLRGTQEHISLKRANGEDVTVTVSLFGYREGRLRVELTEEKTLRVPKLPT